MYFRTAGFQRTFCRLLVWPRSRMDWSAPIDEQIVFAQLVGNTNSIWSLLVASGYLKVLGRGMADSDRTEDICYELTLTNREVWFLFWNMVRDWFGRFDVPAYYNYMVSGSRVRSA